MKRALITAATIAASLGQRIELPNINVSGGQTYFPPNKRNGAKERSRRLRQMERGILKPESRGER